MNGYLREIRAVGHSAARQSLSQGIGKRALTDESGRVPGDRKPGPRRAAATAGTSARQFLMWEMAEHRGRDLSESDEGTRGAHGDTNR